MTGPEPLQNEAKTDPTNAQDPNGIVDQVGDDAKEKDPEPSPGKSKARTAILIFALCLSLCLVPLDTNIVVTALPSITRDFHISNAAFAWIGGAILLAQAVCGPFFAKVSDIFGRKPTLIGSLIIFMVGSVVCSRSHSVAMLLAGRAIQGVGAGGIRVLVNVVGGDIFSERERAMYFGLVGMVFAIAPCIGPLIGAGFSNHWRWCFYINLPLDALAIVLLLFFLDVNNNRTSLKRGLMAIDWLGSLLIIGGLTMFLLGLQFGGTSFPWSSATVICLMVFGVVTVVIFAIYEAWVAEYPVMPISLFQSRDTFAILIFAFCHGTVIISLAYYYVLYMQEALGKTPIISAVVVLAVAVPLGIVALTAGITVRKKGHAVEWIRGGICLGALGVGLSQLMPAYTSFAKLIIFGMMVGAGFAPGYQLPILALQVRVEPKDVATATSTFALMQMMGSAIGVVLGEVIFQAQMKSHAQGLLNAGIPRHIVETLSSGSAFSLSRVLSKVLPHDQLTLVRRALTDSFHKQWFLYLAFTCLAFLASLVIRNQELKKVHIVHKTGLVEKLKARRDEEKATSHE